MVDGDEQFEFRVEFGEDIFDEEVHEIEAEDVDIDIGSVITSRGIIPRRKYPKGRYRCT